MITLWCIGVRLAFILSYKTYNIKTTEYPFTLIVLKTDFSYQTRCEHEIDNWKVIFFTNSITFQYKSLKIMQWVLVYTFSPFSSVSVTFPKTSSILFSFSLSLYIHHYVIDLNTIRIDNLVRCFITDISPSWRVPARPDLSFGDCTLSLRNTLLLDATRSLWVCKHFVRVRIWF